VTVLIVLVDLLMTHLPSWAVSSIGLLWLIVLAAAGFDAWRSGQRDRAARLERERHSLHGRS
jgi:hypothetical protein